MKIVLAYVLVIPLVQFALLLGSYFPGFLLALLLSWIPDKVGVPIRCFVSGCAGGSTAIAFGFIVFRWLAGAGAFGFFPLLATAVPLLIPIINDYRDYQGLKQEVGGFTPEVEPFVWGKGTIVLGEIVGILFGGYLFIGW